VPPRRRFQSPVPIALVATAAAFAACDSPTAPPRPGERVPIGQVIAGSIKLPDDSVHRYSFLARAGGEYAVFMEATEGVIGLTLRDSVTGEFRAGVLDQLGGPGLELNATENVRASADQVFVIELRGYGLPTNRYRFLVYEVALAPESRAARFTVGDTVEGETLDPVADVDEFIASGQAGEIAGIIHGLDTAGVGLLFLSVTDATTGEQLGGSRGAPGGPEVSTASGRLALPGTRDYRFTVRGLSFERYTGAYRFWFHAINPAPEALSASVALDTEIAGEAIDKFGDVDEFTLSSPADAEFNVFLQGSGPRQTRLEVGPPAGPAPSALLTVPGDTGLFQHATGRFRVNQAGPVTIRVTGLSAFSVADTGAYRFYVYAVNPLPEHVSAAVAAGDTVSGEGIDLPGDVDEFSFSGAAGDEFNVLLQARSGRTDTMRLEIVAPGGAPITAVEGFGTDTSLFQRVTGRFALPATGTYRVRVTGATSTTDGNTGPYRFFLYRIDRHPESVAAALTFGDSVSGESLDLPGDIDEYTVAITDSSGATLALQIETPPGVGDAAVVTLLSTTGDSVSHVRATASGVQLGGGRLHLGPGTHTIRVVGSHFLDRSLLRSAYSLWLYRFSFDAELVVDTFAIGDTVAGEAIDVPGDLDQFHFYGRRGELVNLTLQGMSAVWSGSYETWLSGPGGAESNPFLFVVSPTSAAALGAHQTTRFELPGTGWYHVSVMGSTASGSRLEVGPYRFAVEPIEPVPEQVNGALVPGDSVTAEAIDVLGDWDEYIITAPAGDEVTAVFSAAPPDVNFPYALVFDRATGEPFVEIAGQGIWQSGPVRVPASGELAVAVREHAPTGRYCYDATCGGLFHFVGPYELRVLRVNRSPESVAAAYAVGDTARGEAITPIGDIDEFTSSGAPGESLTPFYRLAAPTVPAGGSITLHVLDPASGAILVGNNYAAPGTSFFSPGSFTVPASGSFLIRIRSYPETSVATAPYEFLFRR
jgi:hypothetical protein